jgi:hypothetical protein
VLLIALGFALVLTGFVPLQVAGVGLLLLALVVPVISGGGKQLDVVPRAKEAVSDQASPQQVSKSASGEGDPSRELDVSRLSIWHRGDQLRVTTVEEDEATLHRLREEGFTVTRVVLDRGLGSIVETEVESMSRSQDVAIREPRMMMEALDLPLPSLEGSFDPHTNEAFLTTVDSSWEMDLEEQDESTTEDPETSSGQARQRGARRDH